jgi:nitroreductase
VSQAPLQNPLPLSSPSTDVDSAILSRMSVRAYLPQAVEREKIAHILQVASRAPSGTNTQPWRVYVMQGASLKALTDKVCAAHDAIRADPAVSAQYKEEYDYYPSNWTEPYLARRRENGWGLYGLLGIERGQKDKMHEQHQRNFRFFDAPVGLIFTDRSSAWPRQFARLRHVCAKRHAGCARARPAHLPAGCLERLSQHHACRTSALPLTR